MDPNNMTEEQKRAVVGQSNFCCLSLFSVAAFCCGVSAASWCAFASRNVVVTGNDIEAACQELGYVIDSINTLDQCKAFLNNHAVGLYGWQATVPENQLICFSYTQYIDGRGWITPPLDSNFWGAYWCSIVANVFGGIAFVTIWLATCCPMSNDRLKSLGCNFFIATLFQGLTFLIFQSNVCTKGFFESYFPDSGNVESVIESVSCGLAIGSQLSIAATVFYFLCMCTLPAAQVPTPIGMSERGAPGEAVEGDAAPA